MTGTPFVTADGANRGASMVKMSVEFPSEAPLCQRISSATAQTTFEQSAISGLFGGIRRQLFVFGSRSEWDYYIGLVGFEPTASWSRTRRSTKLSHSPKSIC